MYAINLSALNSGTAYWTTANTIPAGSQNAPPSSQQQQTRPLKKKRWTQVRNFLRLNSNINDHGPSCRCVRCLHARGKLSIQLVEQPEPDFSPKTPRRAPTPPRRRRNSSHQNTCPTPPRPMVRRNQTEINRKPLPPNASVSIANQRPSQLRILRKPLPPGASVFGYKPAQPDIVPESSDPVSPISASALLALYDNTPISPVSPSSPAISVTASEPDLDQTRINRMSTYSYLDGNTDLSAFDETPYADYFTIRSATPVTLTRASSTAVNTPARQGFVLRTATPVSFQKAKAVDTHGPVRNPSVSSPPRTQRPQLTVATRSIPVPVHQPEIIRLPRIRSQSASVYFGISPESPDSSIRAEQGSIHYVIGSESSSSSASLLATSDGSSDGGSLGSHTMILKKVLIESLDTKSLIKKPFVRK